MVSKLKQYFDYFELQLHYLCFPMSLCSAGPGRFSPSLAPVPAGLGATFSCAYGQNNKMEILLHKSCMENIEHSNLSSPETSYHFHFLGCRQ